MSGKAPVKSFNPEFLASLKKQNETKWQCKACYSYNDLSVDKCRACDADRPSDIKGAPASEKRPASETPIVDDKKPKFGGFTPSTSGFKPGVMKPSSSSPFFNNSTTASTGKTFKFGVGANAVSIPVVAKKEEPKEEPKEEVKEEPKEVKEEPKKVEEDSDSDYMKYDSDGGEHEQLQERDYTEDENAEDIMEGRKDVPFADAITTETPLSKSVNSYELYVFGSGDCGQLGMEEECTQVGIVSVLTMMKFSRLMRFRWKSMTQPNTQL